MTTHWALTTTGTSVLTAFCRPALPDPAALPSLEEILAWARTEPTKASAEFNSLSRVLSSSDDNYVVLFHSDTPDGKLSAEVVKQLIEDSGLAACSVQCVPRLVKHHDEFRSVGLPNFVNLLVAHIRQAQGDRVSLVATGGFKAQLAYANLVGLLMGVPVYYMHEDFTSLVELPPLPVAIDPALGEKFHDFQQIANSNNVSPEQLAKAFSQLPEELHVLIDPANNYSLTAAGVAWYAAATPPVPQKLKKDLSPISGFGTHHMMPGLSQREARGLLEWIARQAGVTKVCYAEMKNDNAGGSTWLEFAPNDQTNPNTLVWWLHMPEGSQKIIAFCEEQSYAHLRASLGFDLHPAGRLG